LRLWTQPAGIRSGLHMARWVEGVGVLSQYSWHFLGWGFVIFLYITFLFLDLGSGFICCLGSRQHCCSFFTLTAPGLALSPCFRPNVPQIPLFVIRYYFLLVDTSSSYMAGSFLAMGAGKQGITGSYSQLGHTFTVAFLLGFLLAIYTVGLRFASCFGPRIADGIGWIFSIGILGSI
jgi:hypothetical protein